MMGSIVSLIAADDWGSGKLLQDLSSAIVCREEEKLVEAPFDGRLSGQRKGRIMFSMQQEEEEQFSNTEVCFYNYTGSPLFLYVLMGRVSGCWKKLAPWCLLHATIKLSSFQGAALGFGGRAAPWYSTLDHALLQKHRKFRVEVMPFEHELRPPCKAWRAKENSKEAKDSAFAQEYYLSVQLKGNPNAKSLTTLKHGENQEFMDPAIWSSIPDNVLYKIFDQLSVLSKVEFSLVCKAWKQEMLLHKQSSSLYGTKGWVLLRSLNKFWRPSDGYCIAWNPRLDRIMHIHLPFPFPELEARQQNEELLGWTASLSRAQELQKATLDVQVGTGSYQVHLTPWSSADESCLWLRFGSQPWGHEQGEMTFLDCGQLVKYGADILVAAMLTPKQSVQWVGIWELKPGSLVWEKIATLSAETEPSVWNDAFETPGVSLEAHVEGKLVTIVRYTTAPTFTPPIAYCFASRAWRVMDLEIPAESRLSYVCSLAGDLVNSETLKIRPQLLE